MYCMSTTMQDTMTMQRFRTAWEMSDSLLQSLKDRWKENELPTSYVINLM